MNLKPPSDPSLRSDGGVPPTREERDGAELIAEIVYDHGTERIEYRKPEPICPLCGFDWRHDTGASGNGAAEAHRRLCGGPNPEARNDFEIETRALADRLEQGWRDGGVMRSHAGDLKRAADRLRSLLSALNTAVASSLPGRTQLEEKKEDQSRGGTQAMSPRQDLPQPASGDSSAPATATEVVIHGASDDIVCVVGKTFSDEFYPQCSEDSEDLIALSDGTLLRVKYDGCWRIQRLFSGSSGFTKIEATGDDGPDHPGGIPGYSDVVKLRGEIKWAALASVYAKASRA